MPHPSNELWSEADEFQSAAEALAAVPAPLGDYPAHAGALARVAVEQCFVISRGLVAVPHGDRAILCLFDNNPLAADPTRRPAEEAELRARLALLGVGVLASVFYPSPGPDAGYTTVLLLDAGPDRSVAIRQEWYQVQRASFALLLAAQRGVTP